MARGSIVDQRVGGVAQLRLLALPRESQLRICRRRVCLVRTLLAVEVHHRAARIIGRIAVLGRLVLATEALERRPRFDQRPVDGEVVVAHQVSGPRLLDNGGEELPGHIVIE